MNKIVLKNDSHIYQLLGMFDDRHGYGLPKDIAELLIRMSKKPVISKDEIDVGTNMAFLKGDCDTEFCLESSILYLVEHATEIGGLVAFTYLTPLTEITEEYFKNLSPDLDITTLKAHKQKRHTQYVTMVAEHERLARSANRRAQKVLVTQPVPEFQDALSQCKRFVRLGKPDYCTSQLQILSQVIEMNNLIHPATEIINRWKTACNNKTSAALLHDAPSELYIPKIALTKKDENSNNGKKIDFKSLLAAMMKETPKKHPARLKPSDSAVKILDAEAEVENDFEPGKVPEICEQLEQAQDGDEIKMQALITALLEKHNTIPSSKTQVRTKATRQDISKAHLVEHAPASLNPDREQ